MNEKLSSIFEATIEKRVFPGANCWLSQGETIVAHEAFGTTAYDAEYSRPVTTQTVYDIASITKLFTTTAFFIAARENQVSVETPLSYFLPEFKTEDKSAITLRDLLHHNSGIKIAIQSFTEISSDEWISRVAQADLHATPATKVLYSCTNLFLIARIVEKLCGMPLDDFMMERIVRPLGMSRTTWFPLQRFSPDEIAPTEIQEKIFTHGVVHDEAARAWQEQTGHASSGNSGLFSTPEDLAKFAQLWRDGGVFGGKQILAGEDIEQAFTDMVPELDPVAQRGLGWQLQAAFFMSDKAPSDSAGHTGFTGPTLWLSRSSGHICIVLNNRVYPTRNGESRLPAHRRVARWLLTETGALPETTA